MRANEFVTEASDPKDPSGQIAIHDQGMAMPIASRYAGDGQFKVTIKNQPYIVTVAGWEIDNHNPGNLDSFYLTDVKTGKTEHVTSGWNYPEAVAIFNNLLTTQKPALRDIYKQDMAFYDEHGWNTGHHPERLQGLKKTGYNAIPADRFVKAHKDMKKVTGQQDVQKDVDEAKAVKQRLDPKCWKGKHKEGTKIKGGVRVNNCVPNESVEEAAGNTKFDTMMNRIKSDPWTQLNSDPNWEYEIEELVNRHIEPWLLSMEKANMPITKDNNTLNPGWRKRYEQVSTQLAQKFLTSKKFNPRDPDLVNKIRAYIDWYTNESNSVHGQLDAYATDLPLQLYLDTPAADEKIADMRAAMFPNDQDEVDDDGYAIRPRPEADPRRLDPGNMEEGLLEEFDLIESIINQIADHNGVDAEVVWEDLESLTEDELYTFAVTSQLNEDWQKVNKKDKTDGMSRKAVSAYRREHPGSKLKTAVTTKPSKLKKGSKASKRRKSYCSRSRGQMKMHNISCAKTPDKAICKARRRWNC
jgi:hypothetical protein